MKNRLRDLVNLIKTRRLPYSWSQKIHKSLYKQKLDDTLNEVFKCPPASCSNNSVAEMHMQLCKADMAMAVLAAKSLLRYINDVKVVVHEDGTLSNDDKRLISQHIHNCRIISPSEANEIAQTNPVLSYNREAFRSRFNLPEGFENRIISRIQKIFDLHTTSETETVFYLDSDTLFLDYPNELKDWLTNQNALPFHTRPKTPNLTVPTSITNRAFPSAEVITAFNSGFFGFRKKQITETCVEEVTSVLLNNRDVAVLGDESVWRFIYSKNQVQCFEFEKYPLFEFKKVYTGLRANPELKYLHFLGKHKFGLYQKEAKKVINELKV